MPTGTLDYELFDYKAEEKPLSLDEAIRKAQEMRRVDDQHFYRVRPINSEMTEFAVKKVDISEAHAAFLTRVARLLSKSWRRR